MPSRILILTYESPQANLITARLLAAYPRHVAGIVCSNTIVPGHGRARSAAFLLRHTGLGFVGRKALELALCRAAWRWCDVTGRSPAVASLTSLARRAGVPLASTTDVNAAATLALVRAWRAEVFVSVNLNQRIGGTLLRLASHGVLNVHGALLPRNRGLFPYFWTLANGDAETGVTVHWVDERLDTGDIVLQRAYPVHADDTVAALAWIGAELGADLLLHALAQIDAGRASRTPQDHRSASYFSWPTRADVRRLRRRKRRYGSVFEGWRNVRAPSPHHERLATLPQCTHCET